jgi:UDP-N-acetylmuramoylalanine--D-glutamate ligase
VTGAQRFAFRRVVVVGAAVAGSAAARALLRRGAIVTVVDRVASSATERLAAEGARILIADDPPAHLYHGVTDVVVSPGIPPQHPVPVAALARGIEVYSEPELAWRLRGPHAPPWLAVTGTNGKTTATTMLATIITAAGWRTAALGNIGEPLVFAATGEPQFGPAPGGPPPAGLAVDEPYEVLAVELSSQQLHWSRTLAPYAGAILNLADDHLDWHGGFDDYAAAKTAIWRAARDPAAGAGVAVGNLDDPRVAALLADVPGRAVGFTLGEPAPGQVGVRDGVLVDAAFADPPVALIGADLVRPPGPHNVANALAAAALARAYGVPAGAVRDGLTGYRPQPHRNSHLVTAGGVSWVDDSKATNPHAALASLLSYPRVVWVAGGQLKGVDVDPLVAAVADRLAGAVLLGVDRGRLAQALARHAPQVRVVEVTGTDDGVMGEVVRAAAALAERGDTVLLAPAAASRDIFDSYVHRGECFAAAVRAAVGEAP